MKEKAEDIIILRKSKMIYKGKIAVLYIYKDQPELRRIMIEKEDEHCS